MVFTFFFWQEDNSSLFREIFGNPNVQYYIKSCNPSCTHLCGVIRTFWVCFFLIACWNLICRLTALIVNHHTILLLKVKSNSHGDGSNTNRCKTAVTASYFNKFDWQSLPWALQSYQRVIVSIHEWLISSYAKPRPSNQNLQSDLFRPF